MHFVMVHNIQYTIHYTAIQAPKWNPSSTAIDYFSNSQSIHTTAPSLHLAIIFHFMVQSWDLQTLSEYKVLGENRNWAPGPIYVYLPT